jgi:hypothetical protein
MERLDEERMETQVLEVVEVEVLVVAVHNLRVVHLQDVVVLVLQETLESEEMGQTV